MKIGVVGATGLVGSKLIELLDKTILPITELRLIASGNSAGSKIKFRGKMLEVVQISDKVFENLDLAFFMATNDIALQYVNIARDAGAVVIDNSSAFRLSGNVPLVVPEVNIDILKKTDRIIANPNCSTIQLVVPLKLLQNIYKIRRVDVSTYQAVSGAGKEAMDEFISEIENYGKQNPDPKILPVKNLSKHYEILNNVIPQIDVFESNGYSKEEMKVIKESHKILNDNFEIGCTSVRVPVLNGHSEAVTVKTEQKICIVDVLNSFRKEKNLIIKDDTENQEYPMAQYCSGHSEVFVGRIRKDLYDDHILHFFVVADNLLKGAAANAIQIAEKCYISDIYGWM